MNTTPRKHVLTIAYDMVLPASTSLDLISTKHRKPSQRRSIQYRSTKEGKRRKKKKKRGTLRSLISWITSYSRTATQAVTKTVFVCQRRSRIAYASNVFMGQ